MESNAVVHPVTGVYQYYRHPITGDEKFTWKRYSENELGQLAKGIRTIKGANTLLFIPKDEVLFTTKNSHMEELYVPSNQIKLKNISPG